MLRAPCEEDGRATNAVLTDAGEAVFVESQGLYADAVQRMVLDGLDDAGVDQLATLSYAILTKLDPDRRLTITADGAACAADPTPPATSSARRILSLCSDRLALGHSAGGRRTAGGFLALRSSGRGNLVASPVGRRHRADFDNGFITRLIAVSRSVYGHS